jgi:threonine/homoserine/homoserine lactone efflux protein
MGQAIGESITFAIGVAISPVPIIAIILMLLSKKASANSLAFALGWVIGVTGVMVVVITAAGAIGTGSGGTPSHGVSIVKIILGLLLLLVGWRDWRKRPKAGQPEELPKWLQAIESITPVKSGALGVALSAVNPKNLLMMVGGGLAIANAPASTGGKVIAVAVFVLLAVSTVVLPVVLFHVLGARGQTMLESLNSWLQTNNAVVMAVLILVIGVVLIGKGIAGF